MSTNKNHGERQIPTVALPCLQYRVANPQRPRINTILQTRTTRNGYAISCFGLTHTPIRTEGLDRKNTATGQVREKAATVYNKRFYEMSALSRVDNICVFSRRSSR